MEARAEGLRIEDVERLDLKSFLRDTAELDLPAQRRLAEMGYACVSGLRVGPAGRAWSAVSRFFDEALRIDAEDVEVHRLRGISALDLAPLDEGDARDKLLGLAFASLDHAVQLAPKDAHFHYLRGFVLYEDRRHPPEEALASFEQALVHEEQHGWARLYKAHCLHDMKRWADAAEAYARVPREQFKGHVAWRMDLLVEQRASCLLEAGHDAEARAEFERLLTYYEKQPRLALMMTLQYLESALARFPELEPRVRNLEKVRDELPPR